MPCHVGTHVDAPCHFIPGAPSIDEVGLDRLCGEGIVGRLRVREPHTITAAELDELDVLAGDILVLDTGWWDAADGDRVDHSHLGEDAAARLVERRVKLLGFDAPTPDLPVHRRPAGFGWPVHHLLLSHGVLVAENLTNLVPELTGRLTFVFAPLPVVGADGAPARVLARRL
jgi:kynurenine formamidase